MSLFKKCFKYTAVACLLVAGPASATDITGTTAYRGTIKAVIPGFYDYVGVSLADGFTCAGLQQVILQVDTARYNEVLAALITAQINRSVVAIAQPAANPRHNSGACTISEVALGGFDGWP